MMKRHEIQVLRKAGLPQAEVARITGVSERTVRSIQVEGVVTEVQDGAERRRRIGRPPKAEPFRNVVAELLGHRAGTDKGFPLNVDIAAAGVCS